MMRTRSAASRGAQTSAATAGRRRRATHEKWLSEITAIPTVAGREQRVIGHVRRWVAERPNLRMRSDKAGNLVITRVPPRGAHSRARKSPLFITAHLDHPAFVIITQPAGSIVELEFRGGVHNPYFERAAIEIIDDTGRTHAARIIALDPHATPFKRATVQLAKSSARIKPGDIGRWRFEHERGSVPRIEKGLLYTHACDDLAAVAAALSAFDVIRSLRGCEHVGLLFTRAEEVGFIGAIAACKHKTVPKSARLICLENSRSFPTDSPIGAGPIVRVGDRLSVFEPTLTNQISALMLEHQKANPAFKFQRKLMPGGACEATAFSAYGYQSTCLCLPLGNYHNMIDIDGVISGKNRNARVGPEFISINDYHGLIEMLVVCAMTLDAADATSLKSRMEGLYREHADVLES